MSTYGCCDTTCFSRCTTALASNNLRSLANWTRMGHDEAGTYSFSRVCHNDCQIGTTGERCFGQSNTWWHSAPLWQFACENTHLRCCQKRATLCIDVTVWAPLTVTLCVSFDLNLLSDTPTMINYLSYQFAVQWTCPWGCWDFFTTECMDFLKLTRRH